MFGCRSRLGRSLLPGVAIVVVGCGPAGATGAAPSAVAPSAASASASASVATPTAAPTTLPTVTHSPAKAPALSLSVIADGLASPVDIADPGDGSGRLFVVEQAGRIRIVEGRRLVTRPFLDISDRVKSGGEQGLLGLAFHPAFPNDRRLYVDYTDVSGDTVVSEFRVDGSDPDVVDPESERALLHVDQPFANHNGGGVVFGPDGMLYVSTGDGGSGGDPLGNGQKLSTLLGKILRIDVDAPNEGASGAYAVPADNPFVGVDGALPEIWLTGLRNPWRIRFDPQTGDLWIGDVGQDAWEEIDVVRAGDKGLNFGWNVMEGFQCYSPSQGCDEHGLTLPVAVYGHDAGCAVIGGVVVRASGQPLLDGWYVFSDSCSGNLWALDPVGAGRREPVRTGRWRGSISSIAQARDGTVIATDLQNGQLLAMSADAP